MIRIFPDLEALSRAAAEMFTDQAEAAVEERGLFRVALSGGQTPRRTYELLAGTPFRERVSWDRIHFFWGDERCVPPDDPRNNARVARQALLDQVPVPAAHIYPIPAGNDPDRASARYEAELHAHFGDQPPVFDLVLLGLGEDGHTASLFPLGPVLGERTRWVAEVRSGPDGLDRVTLTLTVINRARQVCFLVSGEQKACILFRVIHGSEEDHKIPARLIQPVQGRLLWYADRDAARKLLSYARSR